jgi:hypothetical protein
MLRGPVEQSGRLERVTATDRFADYCLWDYNPLAPPLGKLRSASVLWQSLATTGADPRVGEAAELLRQGLGPFRTVWGVKKFDSHFAYEFYFYDYARLERTVSVPRVLKSLNPLVECSLQYSDARPYFMFSLDLDDRIVGQRKLDEISIYIGNPGSTVSSGICYNLSDRGLRLDNFYFFFDAAREMDQIRGKIACSAHLDLPGLQIEQILWPELRNCGVIVVANKKTHDGIYFSRITVDQLLLFLRRTQYPEDLIQFVERNRADLDHMLYDVGIDYRRTEQGLEVVKSAFYGLL